MVATSVRPATASEVASEPAAAGAPVATVVDVMTVGYRADGRVRR
jgi:molecular chaperone GrpE (heat shock protein)